MDVFRVGVTRPVEFLTAVLEAFSGCESAKVSFEGDLEFMHEGGIGGSVAETRSLRRQTIEPLRDFVVVPLSQHNLDILVSLCGRIGVRTRVHHVQIEASGVLVFGAYDNFDPSGVWVTTRFSETTLMRLQRDQVIESYGRVTYVEERGHTEADHSN
jgi:hypothetical protein